MKKLRVFGLALSAVFAIGAIAASVSYAEEEPNAEWLSNGAAIAAAAAATMNMEVILTELVGGASLGSYVPSASMGQWAQARPI